jgi:hypothetical protein
MPRKKISELLEIQPKKQKPRYVKARDIFEITLKDIPTIELMREMRNRNDVCMFHTYMYKSEVKEEVELILGRKVKRAELNEFIEITNHNGNMFNYGDDCGMGNYYEFIERAIKDYFQFEIQKEINKKKEEELEGRFIMPSTYTNLN